MKLRHPLTGGIYTLCEDGDGRLVRVEEQRASGTHALLEEWIAR